MLFAKRARKPRSKIGAIRPKARFHTRLHGIIPPELYGWQFGNPGKRKEIEAFLLTKIVKGHEDKGQHMLLDILYAITTDDFEVIHIPNGGKRHKATGFRMKKAGARAGVYDLWCGWRGGEGWLEVKTAHGTEEPSQIEFGTWCFIVGKKSAVIRSTAEALFHLGNWGAPIKPDFLPLTKLISSQKLNPVAKADLVTS